jgi:hypothetical protein
LSFTSGRPSENQPPPRARQAVLLKALRPLHHEHVVHRAARVEDARDHADEEHAPDGLGVGRGLDDAEILREPTVEARVPVPLERGQIVPHRVKRPFTRPEIDGAVCGVLAEKGQTLALQVHLDGRHVVVAQRTLPLEDRGAQHLVIAKRALELWILVQREQGVRHVADDVVLVPALCALQPGSLGPALAVGLASLGGVGVVHHHRAPHVAGACLV